MKLDPDSELAKKAKQWLRRFESLKKYGPAL